MNRPQLPKTVALVGAVAAAAILVPTAASAAGSLVTISDPGSSNAARVTNDGRLKVDGGGTELAFRTPPGAVSFAAGTSKLLGKVDVSDYSKIRIMADERTGSASNISFRVTTTEGNELVAQLATFTLTAPRAEDLRRRRADLGRVDLRRRRPRLRQRRDRLPRLWQPVTGGPPDQRADPARR